MKLASIQKAFINVLCNKTKEETLLPCLHDDMASCFKERVDIYRVNVKATLLKTLKSTFPVCLRLVGDAFFVGMASEFINGAPPTSPSLNDFGEAFPEFINQFDPAKAVRYLSEVAQLEWLWHVVYYGPDTTVSDFSELSSLTQKEQTKLMFLLPASCAFIHSAYPISKIWWANQDDRREDEMIDLDDESGEDLIIWRTIDDIYIDCLSQDELMFLKCLYDNKQPTVPADKQPFASAIEQLAGIIDIESLISRSVERGWIARYEISADQ